MPQAKDTTSPLLSIHLSQPPSHVYTPNQVISGHVALSASTDIPVDSVTITSYGRAKVKIHQSHGESETIYRSRADFFSVQLELNHSNGGFKAGTREWPFELTCPEGIDEDLLHDTSKEKGKRGTNFRPSVHFWDFENAIAHDSTFQSAEVPFTYANTISPSIDSQAHNLPPAMTYYHGMLGRRAYGFVEYVLCAALTEAEDKRRLMGMRGPKQHVATRVVAFVPGPKQMLMSEEVVGLVVEKRRVLVKIPRAGWGGQVQEVRTAASSDLGNPIQGMVSALSRQSGLFPRLSRSLTFPSTSTTSINTSSSLVLDITIQHPTFIQVLRPQPIPFSISIAPSPNHNYELTASYLPAITIKSFTFHSYAIPAYAPQVSFVIMLMGRLSPSNSQTMFPSTRKSSCLLNLLLGQGLNHQTPRRVHATGRTSSQQPAASMRASQHPSQTPSIPPRSTLESLLG